MGVSHKRSAEAIHWNIRVCICVPCDCILCTQVCVSVYSYMYGQISLKECVCECYVNKDVDFNPASVVLGVIVKGDSSRNDHRM